MWQNAAVDLFFCLSGFTLCYVYRRDAFQFADYVTARIARIYPLYCLTLITSGVSIWPLLSDPTIYPADAAFSDFLRQALMLNSWPVIGSGVHWNFPAWSISVEWFCYILLFPLLLRQAAPRSASIRLLCLALLSATSFTLFMNCFDERITAPAVYAAKSQWGYWAPLLRGTLGFTAGWIIFASFEKRDGLYAFSTRFSIPIWFGFAIILILRYCGFLDAQALVFIFPFVVLAATDIASTTSRLLGSPALHFMGRISYSVYMVHATVLILFIRWLPTPEEWPISIYALLIGTTFVVSIGTHFAIEMPARNAIRNVRFPGFKTSDIVRAPLFVRSQRGTSDDRPDEIL